MPMDNVTLENTQQSISSRDAKSVASVMVNGKWVNLSDTLEQANVKSDVGTVAKQVAAQQEVVSNAVSVADSAQSAADAAVENSLVNSQAIEDINSAVSDATSDAAVARSDGLRAWNAAQSNVNLIDLSYASASASISSARTEALAAADDAKKSASAAQADIVAVKSDVAVVQADVTATKSDVAVAKSDIADTKTSLSSQAKSLSSYAAQASAAGQDITTLKSQAGQIEQDIASTKGDVSQLKVSASSASVTLADAAGNISSLQATAKSYSAALSDTNSNVASVTATASELETKYADAAGDINKLQTDAKGTTQTLNDAQGDIAKLKTRADGFDTQFTNINGSINKIQTDASGTTQTLTNAKSDIAVLQSRADGFDTKYADAAGDINTLKANASGFSQTLVSAKGDISTLQETATGFKNTLTDAQGNISTLQSNVSGLKKTTSDNAGNIATLQATAKTLTSQMSSAQGDISTLKQTSSDFSSRVSGMETSLSDTNSKINSIQANGGGRNLITGTSRDLKTAPDSPSRYNGGLIHGFSSDELSSLAGNQVTARAFIHNTTAHTVNLVIWIDVGGFGVGTGVPAGTDGYSTITAYNINPKATKGDISVRSYTENAAISGVQYKEFEVEKGTVAHDWTPAPEDIDAKITTNTTAINQNKTAIALKADQTTVDKTNGTVQQLQSQLKVQAGQISSKVSSSDLDAKGYATQEYTQTQIKQTADSWNVNLTKLKNDTQASVTKLSIGVEGLTTTVGKVDDRVKKIEDNTDWTTVTGPLDMDTLITTQNIYYRDRNLKNADGETGWAYIQVVSIGERVTQTVWHDRSSIQHTRTGAVNGSNYDWDVWNEIATNSQVTAIKQTVDGIQTQVYNSDGSSKITQLSNVVQSKVSQGDYNSQINQLKNDINLRVQKGNVVSQINEEAGGNTLIQVSNGKGSLILDAGNTIITGKAWIPVASIADLTADQIQAGTLTGSTVHLGDSNSNTIDLGVLSTDYVGFHSKATNGDQTYIDKNGIHNFGATYDTKISQGQITTNLLAVNGGGLIDFRDSNGTGMTVNGSKLAFNVYNIPTGYLSYSAAPLADWPNGTGGNELQIRYEESLAITNTSDTNSRALFSTVDTQIGYHQQGNTTPDVNLTGLLVNNSDRYVRLGSWNSNSKWSRAEFASDGANINCAGLSIGLTNNVIHMYMDGNYSATAIQLKVDGWAWVNGWVEAAGHSQHSTLSSKTRIEEADPNHMLDLVNNTELTTFSFKSEVAEGTEARHIGPIIDDVNDVAQYQMPAEFIAPTKTARDDDNMIGALFGAVQALTKRIKTLESKAN